jgi:hypothetical protein
MRKDFYIAWSTWLSLGFALKVKSSIVWYVTPCSKPSKKPSWNRPQEEPNKWRMFIRGVVWISTQYTALYSGRQDCPQTPLWEPQLHWFFVGYVVNFTELVIRTVNTLCCSKLLTYSTDQSPSWEICSRPATQRIPRLLRELRFMTDFDTVQITAKADFELIRVHSSVKGDGEFIPRPARFPHVFVDRLEMSPSSSSSSSSSSSTFHVRPSDLFPIRINLEL